MSHAAKYKKKAAELELLKQFDKAVAMYVRAIEAGDAEGAEVDVTVLNKVGDLTLRLGRVAEAVSSYERAVEHYTTVGLFNNAIALCNKILRHAPGRAGIYLTLGRVCARKGMRGDATRNFLEYASRMKQEGRTDEAMRSLAEVAGLMPELEEVRRLVEEHAERAGIALPAAASAEQANVAGATRPDSLVFLDIDYDTPVALTPPLGSVRVPTGAPIAAPPAVTPVEPPRTSSLDDLLIFDPHAGDTPLDVPMVLDGLEEAPPAADVVDDMPSLLTPSEPVAVHPALSVADGLTDALGYDPAPPPAGADAPPLDGLVTDEDGAVEAPLPEPPPAVEPEDVLPERPAAVEPEELLSEPPVAVALDDTLPEWRTVAVPEEDLPAPLQVPEQEEPRELDDIVASKTLDRWADKEEGDLGYSDTPVVLPTLTPYGGVEAITPPSYDSIEESPLDAGEASDDADAVLDRLDFDLDAWDEAALAPEGTPTAGAEVPPEVPAEVPAETLALREREPLVFEEPLPEPATQDLSIAELLQSTPLPPAYGPRYSRTIPRLDPHDFILPGELPPIVLPESWIARPASASVATTRPPEDDEGDAAASIASSEPVDVIPDEPAAADPAAPAGHAADARETAPAADALAVEQTPAEAVGVADDLDELDAALTPRESTAAFNLALDRCTRLREEVAAHPGDWARRRRLAEALFEAGDRTAALDELGATALGFEVEGALLDAVRVLDELVRVAPEQVAYHQKRVELSVRLGDRDRLRESYLDLADALVRSGHAVRAEPVYVRVLELDPWDDRARAALGDAAPPPPSAKPSVKPADDGYVNLADWLSDDAAPRDTRMRVKEPTVTGDEDADFDQLLQNFREGVARSLGDDDYESHYDLGVAYKEMGLLDDAVAEFQRALRSPTHRLPAYEALGQCFLEQGSFPVAVTVLSRALHEPGLDDEQRVGVLYLLGYACEALQRRDEARSYYQRVYATDIHFRDVAERLTGLDGGAR